MIPRIIHHIAPEDRDSWHPLWHRCRRSWQTQFPDHEFVLWNDHCDIDTLVRDHYPQHWNLYQAFPVHIMKIDFARLCILHRHGGIYADMDYHCYHNFESDLHDHDIYFVENLTEEFTSATVENSLMAAAANHSFFEHTMRYVQACFIQFRNAFRVDSHGNWRNPHIDYHINNTTGSGMLSMAADSYGRTHYNVGRLCTAEFNNRPSAYAPWFKAKHVHTSLWGEDQLRNDRTREILIADGNACSVNCVPDYARQRLTDTDYVVDFDTYDFHTDYTHGKYLLQDHSNLDEVKQWIRESEQHTSHILTPHDPDTQDHTSDSTQ